MYAQSSYGIIQDCKLQIALWCLQKYKKKLLGRIFRRNGDKDNITEINGLFSQAGVSLLFSAGDIGIDLMSTIHCQTNSLRQTLRPHCNSQYRINVNLISEQPTNNNQFFRSQ